MNGLVREHRMVTKTVGVVQWAKHTHFDSRFGSGINCSLCSKLIPSGRFIPVTGKGKDGRVHGMWVGEDCARKFFGVKNFKEDHIIQHPGAKS